MKHFFINKDLDFECLDQTKFLKEILIEEAQRKVDAVEALVVAEVRGSENFDGDARDVNDQAVVTMESAKADQGPTSPKAP